MLIRTTCLAFSFCICVLLSACATRGAAPQRVELDAGPIARSVALCKTTLAELQNQLGEPMRDGILHRKRVVSWITAWDPLIRYLAVAVRSDGVIVDLYWDIPTEVPWRPRNLCRKN